VNVGAKVIVLPDNRRAADAGTGRRG
ncbi:L,D-transpeptidase, partial [Rhodopseudomonas sp. BR0C11]|nr:L,D-transpeptidase [Rhodopseudomonas sp. BR0C11]